MKATLKEFLQTLGPHEGDAIPAAFVWTSIPLSVAASVTGIRIAPDDFLVNILASVAILGPGLFVANIAARSWRHLKNRNDIEPSFSFITSGLYSMLKPVTYLLRSVGTLDYQTPGREEMTTESLRDALALVMSAVDERLNHIRTSDDDSPFIPVIRELMEVPDLRMVSPIVGGINATHPTSGAVVRATLLAHSYRGNRFYAIYTPRHPDGSKMEGGLIEVFEGFQALKLKGMESGGAGLDHDRRENAKLELMEESYLMGYRDLLDSSIGVLDSLLSELPPIQRKYWSSLAISPSGRGF